VLGRSAVLVGMGLVVGTVSAVALNRVLASLLTEVGSLDVAILVGAAVAVIATAGAACLVPAIGAARLDPVRALKSS
jgi:ABC-type antimicrobial peptide transport system permease subunit